MNNPKRILLAAGGTGGHFFPALATASALDKKGYEVHLSTDKRCMKFIPIESNINFKIIDLYIRSGSKIALMLLPFKITIAFIKALIYVKRLRPSVIIGFGGYPSFPTLLASRVLSVPIILHEQNRFLGKVNRFFASKAELVAFSYASNKNNSDETISASANSETAIKSEYVGDIVREDIKSIKLANDFTHKPIRILIFGGSQGARIFSRTVPAALSLVKDKHPEFTCIITQQASMDDQQQIAEHYKSLGFEHNISDFFYNMNELYQQTDLVIARAGASTIAELSAIGLPAIFIPLPSAAENHQYENAKFIEEMAGGWTIKQNEDLAQNLAAKIITLDKDRTLLSKAANNITSRKSDGVAALVATVQRIVKQ